MPDRIDREGCGPDDAKGGIGPGHDPFGVQVAIEQVLQETIHLWEVKAPVWFHCSPRETSYMRGDSRFMGFPQPESDERKIENPGRPSRILYRKPPHPAGFFYYVVDSTENEGMHKGCDVISIETRDIQTAYSGFLTVIETAQRASGQCRVWRLPRSLPFRREQTPATRYLARCGRVAMLSPI